MVFEAGVEMVCAREPPFDQDWNVQVVAPDICGDTASSWRWTPTTPVNE